jgi:dethiobiotin synthetase
MKGVFITGTDTGVGKTLVACAWVRAARNAGYRCGAMKPVAAGATMKDGSLVNEDTEGLLRALDWPAQRAGLVTPILLREPIAPHIAARIEGRAIGREPIVDALARIGAECDYVVVEGVGGFRVPLDDERDTVDLARDVAMPVVLVVGMRLGCLNHALLTADAITGAGLALAGWVASCVDRDMPYREENIEALERRLPAPRVGTIPYMEPPDPRRAAECLHIPPAR